MEGRELIADKIAEICDIITYKTTAINSEKQTLIGEMMVLAGMIGQDVLSLADEYYRGINEERSSDYADGCDFRRVDAKLFDIHYSCEDCPHEFCTRNLNYTAIKTTKKENKK